VRAVRSAPPGGHLSTLAGEEQPAAAAVGRRGKEPLVVAATERSRRPTLAWGHTGAARTAFAVAPTESPTKNLMCDEFDV
jgi:hypothetical protein